MKSLCGSMIVYLIVRIWEVGKNRVEKKWWVVYESVSIRKYFFYTETSSLHSLSVWPLTKEGYIYRASPAPKRSLDFCSLVQGTTPINFRKQGVMKIFFNPDPTENSKQNIFQCCFLYKKKCRLFSVKLNTFKVKSELFVPMSDGTKH